MKKAALLCGHLLHYLDHLAPVCYYFEMPLITDSEKIARFAKECYPQIEVHLLQPLEITPVYLSQFDRLYVSEKGARQALQPLIQLMTGKRVEFCYCPHGQSDKGLDNPELNPFPEQEMALIYGPLMEKRLEGLPLKKVVVGNLRYKFYQEHRAFYDELVKERPHPTLLYAPTWDDGECGTSFFTHMDRLLNLMPNSLHMIVKLHPLLEESHPAAVHSLEGKKNVEILLDFPLIYPLLNRCDYYLGDYSSIGYDFLVFNRPLFFLGNKKVPLHEAGINLMDADNPFDVILNHSKLQKL